MKTIKLFSIIWIGIMMSSLNNDRGLNPTPTYKIYTNLQEALKNVDSVFSFSYSDENLKAIPKDIYKLKKLKRLRLINNYINYIDKEIANLKDLEELNLFENNLSNLPIEFKELKKLKYLNLSGNRFKSIPEIMCKLDSLSFLYMAGNNIKKYPECFLNLKNLKELDIENWNGKYEIDSVQLMRLRKGLPKTYIGNLQPYAAININR